MMANLPARMLELVGKVNCLRVPWTGTQAEFIILWSGLNIPK